MEKIRRMKNILGQFVTLVLFTLLTMFTNLNYAKAQSCVKGEFDFRVDGHSVVFKATTSGPVLFTYWYFNNQVIGNGDSLKFTFRDTGTFEVCLLVLGYDTVNNQKCHFKYCDKITIKDSCNLRTEFGYKIDGNKVIFEAHSNSSSVKYKWRFSDLNTEPDGRIVKREFKNGTYKVCVLAKDTITGCVADFCRSITINNCDLTAGFDFEADGKNVIYEGRSNSSNAIYAWNFGDGHEARGRIQKYSYGKFGRFEVCLTVIDTVTHCKTRICKIVELDSCNLEAKFGYRVDGNLVLFEAGSNSSNVVYKWLFGDGHDGRGRLIKHEYGKDGDYEVCLIALDTVTKCHVRICKTVVIDHDTCNLEAKFGYRADGNLVLFEAGSNSSNVVYKWLFGDGHDGRGRLIKHEYGKPGKYEVCLIALDTVTRCHVKICKLIVIENDSCDLRANFDFRIDGNVVYFEGESNAREAKYIWNFGDGHDGSGRLIKHEFRKGSYKVCLTVISADGKCKVTVCKEITVDPCELEGGFTFRNYRNKFAFAARSNDANAIYVWNFGDGSVAYGAKTRHEYRKAGVYNVCLTILSRHNKCKITICKRVEVKDRCNIEADFRYVGTNLEYKFEANSNKSRVIYLWEFGDGERSWGKYARHTYHKEGRYTVCVTAIDLITRCRTTTCKEITVKKKCTLEANFRYEVNQYGEVKFLGYTNQDNVKVYWSFGDGHEGKGLKTWHQYRKSGVYTVCMTAISSEGCKVRVCKEIAVRVKQQLLADDDQKVLDDRYIDPNTEVNVRTDLNVQWDISLTPNPVSSSANVTISGAVGTHVEVVNMVGIVVRTTAVTESEVKLELTDLQRGYYFIRVINEANDVRQIKFLKE